jgi:hypothetical protein
MAGPQDPGQPGDTQTGDDAPAYPGHQSGLVDPALQQVVDNQSTDMGSAWSGVAANRIQDYMTAKAIAQQNEAEGQQFTQNLADTKGNLIQAVKNDPGAMDLSLDLASHTVQGLVDQHQHLDDDTRAGIASDLTSDMHGQIVHAGIQRLAEIDQPAALAAIDKYGDKLPEGQADDLRQYADTQDSLRQQDAQAAAQQSQKDAATAGYHAASTYLHSLMDDNGRFAAPQGFMSSVVADPRIATETKLALRAGFQNLHQSGDAPSSDPDTVHDLITRIASPNQPAQFEAIAHVGSNLTVNDAAFINGLLGPKNPAAQADVGQLADTINQAKQTLAHPMNGDAGQAAFGRFTNWLLPALQRGGSLADVTANNVVQRFAPTAAQFQGVTPARGTAANDALMADLRRPGRDAINEGAGPIGEAAMLGAAGGVAGLARGVAGGVAEAVAPSVTDAVGGRAAALGVTPSTGALPTMAGVSKTEAIEAAKTAARRGAVGLAADQTFFDKGVMGEK